MTTARTAGSTARTSGSAGAGAGDLVIRGGTVFDGTGDAGRRADVAVSNGVITEIGRDLRGERELDAVGCAVTPGFIDIHTHYDAQVFWDPMLRPSSYHGVTTVIAGNCGFTLAPIRAGDADYTRRMMAKVEGMPLAALEHGVDWNWETFAEYLDRFEGRIAVVSGGGSGMGRELVRQLAADRCHIATCDVSQEALEETRSLAQEGAPPGTRITTFVADVSDEAQWQRFRDHVVS